MNEILLLLKDLRPEYDYESSDDFVGGGGLDSFDIAQLVAVLEENYKININGLDIIPENFISLETISNLVKKSGGQV